MLATLSAVEFLPTGVQFQRYPFPPASIFPSKLLAWADVTEVVLDFAPPEIRTKQGEVLFVPAPQHAALTPAAHQQGIAMAKRVDVWALLLEPFLDTIVSEAEHAQTLAILDRHGINPTVCAELRRQVHERMRVYNAVLWEWAHLGQYDLLCAHLPLTRQATFHGVYWQSMELARRAQER